MPETVSDSFDEFTVKESATANLLIGLFFFALFVLTFVNFLTQHKVDSDYISSKLNYVMIGTFITSIVFIVKGLMHSTIITINKNGFYYGTTLKTNWNNFINAEVTEEEVTGSYQDNFILIIRFYKPGEEGYFITKIPMRNTFNRSGEEVIAAMRRFTELENK